MWGLTVIMKTNLHNGLSYIPRNIPTVCALLCIVVVWCRSFLPISLRVTSGPSETIFIEIRWRWCIWKKSHAECWPSCPSLNVLNTDKSRHHFSSCCYLVIDFRKRPEKHLTNSLNCRLSWADRVASSIGPLRTNFSEILIEKQTFHSWKCIWKCRLRNGGHFSPGRDELTITNQYVQHYVRVNALKPEHDGRHFADDILECFSTNVITYISIGISLGFVPRAPIDKKLASR